MKRSFLYSNREDMRMRRPCSWMKANSSSQGDKERSVWAECLTHATRTEELFSTLNYETLGSRNSFLNGHLFWEQERIEYRNWDGIEIELNRVAKRRHRRISPGSERRWENGSDNYPQSGNLAQSLQEGKTRLSIYLIDEVATLKEESADKILVQVIVKVSLVLVSRWMGFYPLSAHGKYGIGGQKGPRKKNGRCGARSKQSKEIHAKSLGWSNPQRIFAITKPLLYLSTVVGRRRSSNRM